MKFFDTHDSAEVSEDSSEVWRPAYGQHVNPQWVRLLGLLQMDKNYIRCEGAELETKDGRCILDFLSGYCVHNIGHNHAHVIAELQAQLGERAPAMLQSHVPDMAGELAAELCSRAGRQVQKAFFCSSGSEGIETVIKFARAHTKRPRLLYASGAFHGLTMGALSLMGDSFWKEGFGDFLPGATEIPFADLRELVRQLERGDVAALILEPIQGEGGIRLSPPYYLREAQDLCHKHGALFVLDEVQTGLYRTGEFLAAHHYGVEPDMVVLAKALSGGLVPSGAVLITDAIYNSVYDSLKRAFIHTSTYSENALAMRAGLATLEVFDREGLGDRAQESGAYLCEGLRHALEPYEMVREVRGLGLLCGIEFCSPSSFSLRVSFEAIKRVHPAMFGQMLVMRLYQEGMLTQVCGNNFMVLKVAPPLVITKAQMDRFTSAVHDVVDDLHRSRSFWRDALTLAGRAVRV